MTVAFVDNMMLLPIDEQLETPLMTATTTLSLDHLQVEVCAQANENNEPQLNMFATPPLFVLESNRIITLVPSLLKVADFSKGARRAVLFDNATMECWTSE